MFHDPQILETDVQSDGIVGRLYRPSDQVCRGTILVLGGSGGGVAWSAEMAAKLASQGYAALALAYFRAEGLPHTLANIPLEYFEAALVWLGKQDGLSEQPLAVMGASRGGELALLVAANFPAVGAVVAYAPSSILWGGVGGFISLMKPAWTYRGKSIPWMRSSITPKNFYQAIKMALYGTLRLPWHGTPAFLGAMQDIDLVQHASIPVERIQGPVLLISGTDDQMWPSSQLCKMATSRLQAHGHPFDDRHLDYQDAGHAIGLPGLPIEMYPTIIHHPVTRMVYAMGGVPEQNARASESAWVEVVEFLDKHLGTQER